MTLIMILQLVIAIGLINVWLLRFNKATEYRGGDAKNMKEEFIAYGLPIWLMYLVGAMKIAIAILNWNGLSLLKNHLKVVIENDDINLLKDVAKNFTLLSKQKLNIAFVEVVSSNEMNSDQKDDITNSLSELINKKIDINFDVDKNLIGGLKIKVDDTLYDSSLQTKLENAKSKLVGV